MITNEDIYAYIFKRQGLNERSAVKLCKIAGSFENIINTDFETILLDRLLGGEQDDTDLERVILNKLKIIIDKIIKDEDRLIDEARIFFSHLLARKIEWTHLTASDYPQRLLNIPDPPLMLFYKGRLPKENELSLAIVGARECSSYGEKVAGMFSKELSAEGVQIISGMARGIDGIAQRCAVDVSGSTFGVLGCGVDVVYPKENSDIFEKILDKGGLISEFEPGTQPLRRFFPLRNRLISGLSDAVLVVEARKRSGTYITVTQALEQGREVYAVPGRITDALSDGCNNLIASGAGIAVSPEDVLRELRNTSVFRPIYDSYRPECREYYDEISRMIDDCDYEESDPDDEKIKGKISLKDLIVSSIKQSDLSADAIYSKFEGKYEFEDILTSLIELETENRIRKTGCRYCII